MGKGDRNRQPARRVRRALRRTPDRYFDLIQWLLDHRHASTRKQAKDLILARRVKADSHALGVAKRPVQTPNGIEEIDVILPHVPIALKERVLVEAAS